MALQEITENCPEIQAAERQVLSRLDEICRIANSGRCDNDINVVSELEHNEDALEVICHFCPDIARQVALGNWDRSDEVFGVISMFLVAATFAKRANEPKRKFYKISEKLIVLEAPEPLREGTPANPTPAA
ncbi:MAG: hypothetical protein WAL52_06345 [Candidatus Sulfotelmatobacter sp.]